MKEIERIATRSRLDMTDSETGKIIEMLKSRGLYNDKETLSWNLKRFVFSEAGLGRPDTVKERRRKLSLERYYRLKEDDLK